jgi:hypothetical protein
MCVEELMSVICGYGLAILNFNVYNPLCIYYHLKNIFVMFVPPKFSVGSLYDML